MNGIRTLYQTKPFWARVNEGTFRCAAAKMCDLVTPTFAQPPQTSRNIHTDRTCLTVATSELQPNFVIRMLRKVGLPEIGKYKRRTAGYLLYNNLNDNINYMDFFTEFKMADTFFSWFIITELHVWMLMLRLTAEGKYGQDIRNAIVEALWDDVNTRKSKLRGANITALKNQINELSKQFNGAIIGYDEGIMSDDKVLAGAIWRRFFQCEGNNPEALEKLVIYIRKQVNELDKLSREDLISRNSIKWISIKKL